MTSALDDAMNWIAEGAQSSIQTDSYDTAGQRAAALAELLDALHRFAPSISAPLQAQFGPLLKDLADLQIRAREAAELRKTAHTLSTQLDLVRAAAVTGKIELFFNRPHYDADRRAVEQSMGTPLPEMVADLHGGTALAERYRPQMADLRAQVEAADQGRLYLFALVEALRAQLREEVQAGRLRRGAVPRIFRAAHARMKDQEPE